MVEGACVGALLEKYLKQAVYSGSSQFAWQWSDRAVDVIVVQVLKIMLKVLTIVCNKID